MSIDQIALNTIKELKKKNKLIICCGTGISTYAPSNLPTWDDFQKEFFNFGIDFLNNEERKNIQHYLLRAKKKPELKNKCLKSISAIIKDSLSEQLIYHKKDIEGHFHHWIEDQFAGAEKNKLHEYILNSGYPFILTTNYDTLLEKGLDRENNVVISCITQVSELAECIYNRKEKDIENVIVHIHSDYEMISLEDFILVNDDFSKLIKKHPAFVLGLQTLFIQYSVLFVGLGVSDLHFINLLHDLTHDIQWRKSDKLPNYFFVLEKSKSKDYLVQKKIAKFRGKILAIDDYKTDTEVILKELLDCDQK